MERMALVVLAILFLVSCRSDYPRQKATQAAPARSVPAQVDEPADSNAQADRKLEEIKKRHRLIHIGRRDQTVNVVTGMLTADQLKQIEKEIQDVVGAQCKVTFLIK